MKVQSCGGKASKVLLLLVNIFIFLLGGGFLGVGIYYHVDGGLYQNVSFHLYNIEKGEISQ